MMNINNLYEKINKIVPIVGVSIGKPDDKATWRVDYINEPTAQQLKSIAAIISDFKLASKEEARAEQAALQDAKKYLADTADTILSYLEAQASNVAYSPLTSKAYKDLIAARAAARATITQDEGA